MSPLFFKLMRKIVAELDPKLEKYRPAKVEPPKPDLRPKSKAELIDLLAKTPKSVLSREERHMISAIMTFGDKPVQDLMLPKSKMVIVHEDDFLGPLKLDRLYKSGFQHFPLVDNSGRITGLIHTCELDPLKIKKTDKAIKYRDSKVYYIREDHSLRMALAAILRTNCHFLLVINRQKQVVGLLTYAMVAESMLGEKVEDDFDGDQNIALVASREN